MFVLETGLSLSASPLMWQHLALLYCILLLCCTRLQRSSTLSQLHSTGEEDNGIVASRRRYVGSAATCLWVTGTEMSLGPELQSLAGRYVGDAAAMQ